MVLFRLAVQHQIMTAIGLHMGHTRREGDALLVSVDGFARVFNVTQLFEEALRCCDRIADQTTNHGIFGAAQLRHRA